MKKGSAKTLMLMLVILAGLALIFMITLKANIQTDQPAQAEQKQDETKLEQRQDTKDRTRDRRDYSGELDDFRRMVVNLEQKDMAMFKNQSRDAFMELADLIDGLKKGSASDDDDVLNGRSTVKEDDTESIRRSARNIVAAENEDDLVRELKNSFKASEEALEEQTDEAADDDRYETSLDNIETGIEEINKENYMQKTKDLFLRFHSVLKDMHGEMAKRETR